MEWLKYILECLKQAWRWFINVPGLSELVVAFLTWLAGRLWKKFKIWRHHKWLEKINAATATDYNDRIVTFDTVSPCYKREMAKMKLLDKHFIFEIPEKKRAELASIKSLDGEQKFAIHESAELDGDNHKLYDFLAKYYPKRFPDRASMDTFLGEKICSTADYFINRLNQDLLAFNNKQVGVYEFELGRKGKDQGHGIEIPYLDMYLYETDYFTAQVMVHVYQYLRQLDLEYKKEDKYYISPFDDIDYKKLSNEMPHFMSSLGVGGYVIYDKKEGLEYWTVSRSDRVRNGSEKGVELRSYSFDETMDLMDKEAEDIKGRAVIDLYKGATRAIQEELGLFDKNDTRVEGHLGDFNFTGLILIRTQEKDSSKSRFEMQLLGYAFLHFSTKFTYKDLILKKRKAQDSAFEAVHVYENKLTDELKNDGVAENGVPYTHTPESVYYAELLRNIEDMNEIKPYYDL